MTRLKRKEAIPLSNALQDFLRAYKLTAALNTQRVFEAWDEVSGAARYTTNRFYKDGKLYITTNSSVARSQLQFQKDILVERINELLSQDELFTKDDKFVGYVKQLIIK